MKILYIKPTISNAKKLIARLFNKNTVGSYVMQAEKGVFAFVFLPLLASRLGISVFGVFSTFYSLSVIAGLVVDYGLSQTSIKLLAVAKNEEKHNIACAVVLTRLALTIPVACIALVLSFWALPMNGHFILAMIAILNIYAVSISPVFVFQAKEKTFEIGSVLFIVRILATILTYACIRTPDDLDLAVAIHLYTIYVGVGVGWVILVAKYRFKINLVSAKTIRAIISDGFNFAFANIGSSLYGNGSIFLLSLVSSSLQVGLFSLALTFIRGICSILAPVTQSYSPKISRLYEESFVKACSAVRKVMLIQALVACALVFMVWTILLFMMYFGHYENISELFLLIILLSPTIVSTSISSMLVLFVIIPMGTHVFYRDLIVISSIISTACLLFLGYFYRSYGAALSIMITETIVCIAIFNHSLRVIKSSSE